MYHRCLLHYCHHTSLAASAPPSLTPWLPFSVAVRPDLSPLTASCRLWLLFLPPPPLGPFPYDAARCPRPVVFLRHALISDASQPLVLLLLLPQPLVILSLPSPLRPLPLPDLLPLSPACDLLSLACDSHRSSTRTHSSCCCFRLRSDRAASAPSTLAGTLVPCHLARVWHLVKLLELGIS